VTLLAGSQTAARPITECTAQQLPAPALLPVYWLFGALLADTHKKSAMLLLLLL
jgi:hypothetical protein